jgi:hypothetical protein
MCSDSVMVRHMQSKFRSFLSCHGLGLLNYSGVPAPATGSQQDAGSLRSAADISARTAVISIRTPAIGLHSIEFHA